MFCDGFSDRLLNVNLVGLLRWRVRDWSTTLGWRTEAALVAITARAVPFGYRGHPLPPCTTAAVEAIADGELRRLSHCSAWLGVWMRAPIGVRTSVWRRRRSTWHLLWHWMRRGICWRRWELGLDCRILGIRLGAMLGNCKLGAQAHVVVEAHRDLMRVGTGRVGRHLRGETRKEALLGLLPAEEARSWSRACRTDVGSTMCLLV